MSRGLLLPAVFLVVQALGNRPDFRFVFKKLEIKGGQTNATPLLFVVAINGRDPTAPLVLLPTCPDFPEMLCLMSAWGAGQRGSCRELGQHEEQR